jgi:hypothetical protein
MFFGGAYDHYLWGAKKVFNGLSQKRSINIEKQPYKAIHDEMIYIM